ncbi:hypothetical protein ABH927_005506 [Planotetraspora sp. GP83]
MTPAQTTALPSGLRGKGTPGREAPGKGNSRKGNSRKGKRGGKSPLGAPERER